MTRKTIANALVACLAVAISVGLAKVLENFLSLPTVYESYSRQECVSVEPAGSCDKLPAKFHHVWVE